MCVIQSVSNYKGHTLVEMMLATGLGVFLMGGIFSVKNIKSLRYKLFSLTGLDLWLTYLYFCSRSWLGKLKKIKKAWDLVAEELSDQQSLLDRGLAKATKVLALQRTEAQLSGQMGDLSARKAEYEGRITEIDIEITSLDAGRREEAITNLRDQQFRALELEERARALHEKLSRMDIKAPVSGIVYGLTVFAERSVIRPADPVLFLIPQDRPLIIAARVEPIHIDEIFTGQEVTLRFSSLDQRTTPELLGRVVQISADAFQDDARQISYYRAEIVLSEGEQDKIPQGITLIPGMPVESFIKTNDRTPLAYLVKPLADYFAKAMRES